MPQNFDDNEQNALNLIQAANTALQILHDHGFKLDDPINMLAIQLVGPVLSLAAGEHPDNLQLVMQNITDMAKLMDIEKVRLLIQQGVRIV